MTPLFSIVVPTYNRALRLQGAIASVLAQTLEDWELIIVDDGSTDNTAEVVASFGDKRIKYLKNEVNMERSRSRNRGIEAATGEYVCFLDSDDHYRSNHLAVLKEAIAQTVDKAAFFFTGYVWNFPDRVEEVKLPPVASSALSAVEYIIQYQPAPSASCVHRALLKDNLFNPSLIVNEDVELFARIVSRSSLIKLEAYTVDFYIHNQNTKSLFKEYITPQVKAFELMLAQPQVAQNISKAFKRERFRSLSHQLINQLNELGEFRKMNWAIVKHLVQYPSDAQNKSKLVMLLYHLPVLGALIKGLVRIVKKRQ